MRQVIHLVELALSEHGHGRSEMPPKLGLHPQPGSLMHAMPAYVPAAAAAGVKWVTAFPENRRRGLPAVSGTLLLNDPETGLPQAIVDATWITAVRTGASAAVAAKHLGPPDAASLAVIGPGVVGRAAVAALREVLPKLTTVLAYAPRRAAVELFAAEVETQQGIKVEAAASAEAAAAGSEIVITAAPWPRAAGASRLAAGALNNTSFCCALDLDSTIPAAAARNAGRFFADDVLTFESHRQHGYFENWPAPAKLAALVARGGEQRRQGEQVICANLGLGIYDVVVGRAVLELARERNIGVELPL